jgi:HAMP domain-containing protein
MRGQSDLGSFGSRVAQRVFVLFLVCALLPTCVVGLFAWGRSSSELERAAREQMRRDSKSEGMAILSRLLVADGMLRALGDTSVRSEVVAPGDPARGTVPWRSVGPERPTTLPGGPLAVHERAALEAGLSALRVLPERRVWLVRAPDPERPGRLVAAELEPSYLWTFEPGDGDAGLTVLDAGGALAFSSLPEETARFVAAGQVEDPIAEPWLLFLESRFGSAPWHVIRSQSRTATLAPLQEFRDVFRWSLLLALLLVTALSSIQIRRTLRPVHLLARAAARLGEGRWDTRAGISSRDEVGELGRAFDGMAGRIERHVKALASASAFGVALSEERSDAWLGELVLTALVDVTGAASAVLLRPRAGGALACLATAGRETAAAAAAFEATRLGEPVLRAAASGEPACLAFPLLDREGRLSRSPTRSTSTVPRSRASASRRSRPRARSPRRPPWRCATASWSTSSARCSKA